MAPLPGGQRLVAELANGQLASWGHRMLPGDSSCVVRCRPDLVRSRPTSRSTSTGSSRCVTASSSGSPTEPGRSLTRPCPEQPARRRERLPSPTCCAASGVGPGRPGRATAGPCSHSDRPHTNGRLVVAHRYLGTTSGPRLSAGSSAGTASRRSRSSNQERAPFPVRYPSRLTSKHE